MAALCVLVALVWCAAVPAPADAADRAPRPILSSHGVHVRAAFIGQCPRRQPPGEPDCGIPDFFGTTKPVPVHRGGVLRIDVRKRARRVRLDLDCGHRRLDSGSRRRWRFEITGAGCSVGSLYVRYRNVDATYTFNLRQHRHCRPPGSEMVARNGVARIYTEEVVEDGDDYAVFVACRLATEETRVLGRDGCGDAYTGCDFLGQAMLAGDKVAYVAGHYNGRYGPDRRSSLVVLDTSTWQIEREIAEREDYEAVARRFTAVVLKPNGSIGWILHRRDSAWDGYSTYYTETYEVRKSDTTGSNVLLDSGADVDPESLTLNGSTLTWMRAGEARSATLD